MSHPQGEQSFRDPIPFLPNSGLGVRGPLHAPAGDLLLQKVRGCVAEFWEFIYHRPIAFMSTRCADASMYSPRAAFFALDAARQRDI